MSAGQYDFINLQSYLNENHTHFLNPRLLLDRRIRRDGDPSGGPLLVFVENGDLGVLVSRRQDQLAFYLRLRERR